MTSLINIQQNSIQNRSILTFGITFHCTKILTGVKKFCGQAVVTGWAWQPKGWPSVHSHTYLKNGLGRGGGWPAIGCCTDVSEPTRASSLVTVSATVGVHAGWIPAWRERNQSEPGNGNALWLEEIVVERSWLLESRVRRNAFKSDLFASLLREP